MHADMPEQVDGLPNLCGSEDLVAAATGRTVSHDRDGSTVDLARIRSGFANALHMHQPLIPAGGNDLHSARIISNLQYMFEHQDEKDNHNASVFRWCYRRMGELIPELADAGREPRIMLDYSGCLLHGLRVMGLDDVFDDLERITCDARYRRHVEWLGSTWGHAVAPSTPVRDYRLHVRAWQHHFAAIFGLEALGRVRGFSPAEMALPNHPDVCFELVKTLRECGYRWVLVQEHTVERADDGGAIAAPHLPHRLVARSSRDESASIVAIVKTQGSDTKLVAQMQPYYEARGLGRQPLAGHALPPLVTQIADGENGGVMMNDFPPKYREVMAEASGSETPPLNVTEYLAYLEQCGVGEDDLPMIQPVQQKRVWDRFERGAGPEALERVIAELRAEDGRFHMEGGSWTNDVSWVRGYAGVLGPMEEVSALFDRKVVTPGVATSEGRYRNALFHLLVTQTSCFRYWGEGPWTDYGRELCRRAMEILRKDF
jgi:hypothetical protein